MNVKEQTLRSICPEEGYYLTQASDVPLKDRVFSTLVILGKGETMLHWKEITKEEAEMLKKERERLEAEDNANRAKAKEIAELEQRLKALKNE